MGSVRRLAIPTSILLVLAASGLAAEVPVPPPGDDLATLTRTARAGTVFVLEEGVYAGNVVALASITVRGAGPGRTVLAFPGDAPAAWGAGGTLTLEDLTVAPEGNAQAVSGKNLVLENVEVRDTRWDGVSVEGGKLVLRATTIHGVGKCGVRAKAAEVEIRDCRFERCGEHGVWLEEGARGAVADSRVRRSGRHGIGVAGPGSLTVTGTTSSLNARAGLGAFEKGASLVAKGCTLRDNELAGALAQRGAKLVLETSFVGWGSFAGASATGSARLEIVSCTFYANEGPSVWAEDGARVAVCRSILFGAGLRSVSAGMVAEPGERPVPVVTVEANDVFRFPRPYFGVAPDVKSKAVDPCFLDPAGGDFRPHPGSPVVLGKGHLGAFAPPAEGPDLLAARAAYSRGIAAALSGRLDRALIDLRRAAAAEPGYAPAAEDLGDVLRIAGRSREALTAFAGAVRADWLDVRAYDGLALAAADLGLAARSRSASQAVRLVRGLAPARRSYPVEGLGARDALESMGACLLLGREEDYRAERALFVRRFPAKAAAIGEEDLRRTAAAAMRRRSGWEPRAAPFSVEGFEEEEAGERR